MTGMDADHFGIVNACIQGDRIVDDRTMGSVAILQDRLTRLKHTHDLLAGVSFSPQVERLSACSTVSTVG